MCMWHVRCGTWIASWLTCQPFCFQRAVTIDASPPAFAQVGLILPGQMMTIVMERGTKGRVRAMVPLDSISRQVTFMCMCMCMCVCICMCMLWSARQWTPYRHKASLTTLPHMPRGTTPCLASDLQIWPCMPWGTKPCLTSPDGRVGILGPPLALSLISTRSPVISCQVETLAMTGTASQVHSVPSLLPSPRLASPCEVASDLI